jgi:hypothetical protein
VGFGSRRKKDVAGKFGKISKSHAQRLPRVSEGI